MATDNDWQHTGCTLDAFLRAASGDSMAMLVVVATDSQHTWSAQARGLRLEKLVSCSKGKAGTWLLFRVLLVSLNYNNDQARILLVSLNYNNDQARIYRGCKGSKNDAAALNLP